MPKEKEETVLIFCTKGKAMSSVPTITQWQSEVQDHLPSLSRCQAQVLGLWSYAIVQAKSCGMTQVSNWLANLLEVPRARLRQRLREWDYEAAAKRGKHRREVQVKACFAELLGWVVAQWQGDHQMALALDASTLGERFTVIAVSVVYRGCAIPVAWQILQANVAGEWQGSIEALFASLGGVIPADWHVIVMVDRGLYAAWLYQTIQRLGWHPVMRVKEGMSFRANGEDHAGPIGERVTHRGSKWAGRGVWSEQGTPMEGTLLVRWEGGYEEKLAVVTDLAPEEADAAWYQMRFWIEDEFKDEKRGGWRWEQTKMSKPERAQRRWLAMAVATQWVVRVGGEQEAREQAATPKKAGTRRKVGRPPKQFHRPRGREVSCFVRGQQAISTAVAQGKSLPTGRLIAEAWPKQVYAVGKPPSSWVKKRKHKEERKRQRKSKQAEAKYKQRADQQAKVRQERLQRQAAREQRRREQVNRQVQRQEARAQREEDQRRACQAQRERERVQHTEAQKQERERKRLQRHREQEAQRLQRQQWHEECAQARRERQARRQERLARQAHAGSDEAHLGPVRQVNSP